jgi:hypothetical protein
MISYGVLVNLFHVFIVAGLFAYMGMAKEKTPRWVFNALLVTAPLVAVYHVYRALQKTGALDTR